MSSAFHALKDPMSLVTRYRPQAHSSPPRAKGPRRLLTTTSKVLAALDAPQEHIDTEEDDPIEITGPILLGPCAKAKGKTPVVPRKLVPSKQLHSIFSNAGMPKTKESVEVVNAATPDDIKSPQDSQPLPSYSYKDFSPEPAIVYTQHEEEANDLVQTLRGPLGFDIEWRVFFRAKAPERPTALVQVSDENLVLLIQISAMNRFPQKLKEIIESKDITKIGANINNDGQKLFRDYGILARNLVELGSLARQADPDFVQAFGSKRSIVSLAKVVGRYCGKTLAKGKERTGNWEAVLRPRMIEYAANDAHCALVVYKKITDMAVANGRTFTPAGYTSDVTPMSASHSRLAMESSVASTSTSRSTSGSTDTLQKPPVALVRPQHMRAYRFWHRDNLPLESICAQLRSKEEPLKESTVISYVISALQTDSKLPFEMERLKALVQSEAWSWRRHREWILNADKEGRGAS